MAEPQTPSTEPVRGTFWDQPITRGKVPGARHAQVVRALTLGLPLIAALLVLTVMAWPRLQAAIAPEVREATTPPAAGRNQLVNPSFKGLDSSQEPYVVNAAHAEQSLDNQNIILLDHPIGDMLQKNGHHVGAEADHGTYQQREKTLLLEGHVVLREDEGYRFMTSKMLVNTETRRAFSDQPVQGGGPSGTIEASGVQGSGDDSTLIFTGPAKMRLYPTPLPAVNLPNNGPVAGVTP